MKFLFLLIPFLAFSQEQVVKGFVLDAETKAPIPYVNISILDSQIGTSSDQDGSYLLNIKEKHLGKTIHISSLGYKDSMFNISSFLKLNKVLLTPLVEELDEVVISEKFKEQFLEINPIVKKDLYGGFGMSKRPWEIALFFPNKDGYADTEYLHNVKVKLAKYYLMKPRKSKFRVRVLSVSNDSLPERDLLSKSVIVEVEKKQRDVVIDLSEYDITFPENGLFIALEGLAIPYNAFKNNYTAIDEDGNKKKIKEIAYAPRFGAILSDLDKYIVASYHNGKWWRHNITHPQKSKMFVPAISLTLSN